MILIQLTGLSGAGKTTLSYIVRERLQKSGYRVEVIDGDEYRRSLCHDLGFSREDRNENIRRLGFVGKMLARNGVIAILSAVNPYDDVRLELREDAAVRTVWIHSDLEVLVGRDTKGLYRRALLPDDHPEKLKNLTGVNDPFEPPTVADLVIRTDRETVEESADRLLEFVFAALREQRNPPPKALFIGRWQPFHNGHKWLIDQKLAHGIPVLIAVRDVEPDASNPMTTAQTVEILSTVYADRDVEIITIPDIESVNYGRGVGYEINEFEPPPAIGTISATEIRAQIRNGSDGWKSMVDERIHTLIARHLS